MLDSFIFENHLGHRFVGLENNVYLNESELRDYSWDYDVINNRISRFYRSIKDRKLPLVVMCTTTEEAAEVKNRLLELAEADIATNQPGTIYVGGYYTKGFITASKKSEYLISGRYCKIELILTSDNPAWFREEGHSFRPVGNSDGSAAVSGTDYPYDYPYDYALALSNSRIVCDTAGSNAFKLRIYGPVIDPSVLVGTHKYAVTGSVGEGETLLIDSLSKTITLTTAQGNTQNWFHRRGRENYIFEPIPPGVQLVNWSGLFGFDLTIIEERSEPKWT